ncbi:MULTISPECIES: hypothetical protein [unclassified Bartonella]|uniref:hypothetical protein n=1 Tax=unclassified Bartonella TaxID=2645622 RepID=UPI0035D0BB80
MSEKGLVLSHQATRVELTGSVHIRAEDLQHNQKSVSKIRWRKPQTRRSQNGVSPQPLTPFKGVYHA